MGRASRQKYLCTIKKLKAFAKTSAKTVYISLSPAAVLPVRKQEPWLNLFGLKFMSWRPGSPPQQTLFLRRLVTYVSIPFKMIILIPWPLYIPYGHTIFRRSLRPWNGRILIEGWIQLSLPWTPWSVDSGKKAISPASRQIMRHIR
jgi:hypothetical protein